MEQLNGLKAEAIEVLKQLISIPSLSREEERTGQFLALILQEYGVSVSQRMNNVWAQNAHFDPTKPSILLNSHHDTVKPNAAYTKNPFEPLVQDGKLYGLGSNDAGGCLVSLMATFLYYYNQPNLKYNLIFLASAEEEISGKNGVESVLPLLPKGIEFGLVGEPTLLEMAIAEKGLMVLDCVARGVTGHAAREEGENAIYKALEDVAWFKSYQFDRVSAALGPVKMSTTIIEAGAQHNVVPEKCTFTVDVRTTDAYSNLEVLELIRSHVRSEVTPRSTRLNPSSIDEHHPVVQAGRFMGKGTYGSPTMSDQALMPFPTLKMGPGDSARSHSADEYIYIEEIEEGIETYVKLLGHIL